MRTCCRCGRKLRHAEDGLCLLCALALNAWFDAWCYEELATQRLCAGSRA
jgi:hypothetical protein